MNDALDEFYAGLNALEYRIPYAPLPRWPLYNNECDHELIEIASWGGDITYHCARCSYQALGMLRAY